MFTRLLTLLLIICSMVNSSEVAYKVSKIGKEYKLSKDGVSQGIAAITSSKDTKSVFGQYFWYFPGRAASYVDMSPPSPYTPETFTDILKIAPGLFSATFVPKKPILSFFESSSNSSTDRVVCPNGVTLSSLDAFECTAPDTVLNPVSVHYQKVVELADKSLSLSFSVFNATASHHVSAITIAFYRLYRLENYKLSIDAAIKANEFRASNSEFAVGISFAAIALFLFSLLMIFVVMQNWLSPCCCESSPSMAFLLWLLVWIGLCLGATFIGRFWGLIAISLLFIPGMFVCFCVYRCKKHDYSPLAASQNDFEADVQELHPIVDCSQSNSPLGKRQNLLVWLFFIIACISLAAILVIVAMWSQPDYYVFDRSQANAVIEFKPQFLKMGQALLYTFPGVSKWLQLTKVFDWITTYCGVHFREPLLTDEAKRSAIYEPFIQTYSIDMTIYDKKLYTQYASVNDFFTRKLALNVRPLSYDGDEHVVVAPAEGRTIVFDSVPTDLHFWIKGENFTTNALMDINNIHVNDPTWKPEAFVDGGMAIVRLAPQDFHRFSSPIGGIVVSQHVVKGTLESVSSDAMRNSNEAYYNQRVVSILKTPQFGFVSFIAIGASCVGSVVMTEGEGSTLYKGAEIGYFQYGGSTIVILFEKNKIRWDEDLFRHSQLSIETLVQVKTRLGHTKK